MVHSNTNFAQFDACQTGDNVAAKNCFVDLPQVAADQNQFQALLAIVFGVAAAFAILSLMIAAFHYVTSEGDAEKISRSKKTIIFSLIGLALALFAEAIALTVLGKL